MSKIVVYRDPDFMTLGAVRTAEEAAERASDAAIQAAVDAAAAISAAQQAVSDAGVADGKADAAANAAAIADGKAVAAANAATVADGKAVVADAKAVAAASSAAVADGKAVAAHNAADANAAIRDKREFPDLPTLLANATLIYGPGAAQVQAGDIIRTRAEGFAYRVIAVGNSDYDIATAGGVRLYLLPSAAGHYNFAGMAPAADGVTDDYPKLKRLLDRPGTAWSQYPAANQSSPPIYFPNGEYFMASTIELKRQVHLFGEGSGKPWGASAQLIFPPDTHGIIVHSHDTIGEGIQSPATTGGGASLIEGLKLRSSAGARRDRHGIWLRARAVIRGVQVRAFSGDGVHIVATSGAPLPIEQGNANNWHVEQIRTEYNAGHGFYVRGADVNAGTAIAIDSSWNGRCGIWDQSFLGNTYMGCHTEFNGVSGAALGTNAPDQSAYVNFDGRNYIAHWNATEQQLVDTTPGTDGGIWIDDGAGGVHPTRPTWTSGKPAGTYFSAFSYRSNNPNSRNLFLGCYMESGQPGAVFDSPVALAIGGIYGRVLTGSWLRTGLTGPQIDAITATNGTVETRLGNKAAGSGDVLTFYAPADGADTWSFRRAGLDWVLNNKNLGSRVAMWLSGHGTENLMGTSEPKPYVMGFPAIGLGTGSTARRIVQWGGGGVPNSGIWGRGDIAVNLYPSPSGTAAWVCTTAGTGGSTAVFKAISLGA